MVRLLPIIAALLLASAPAQSLDDRLNGLLHLLYLVAAALGVLLVVVLLFAFRTYRKNKDSKDLPE